MAKDEKPTDVSEKSMPVMKIVILAVVLSVVLSGSGVGITMYFASGLADQLSEQQQESVDESEAEADDAPPKYQSMDPKFIISFNEEEEARYMQFSLEIMTRNDDVIKLLNDHMPAVRSSLLLLFGSQSSQDLNSREGKEKLLAEITADINTTLARLSSDMDLGNGVEAAYFNSFIIQ